jgi:hypothetical protein
MSGWRIRSPDSRVRERQVCGGLRRGPAASRVASASCPIRHEGCLLLPLPLGEGQGEGAWKLSRRRRRPGVGSGLRSPGRARRPEGKQFVASPKHPHPACGRPLPEGEAERGRERQARSRFAPHMPNSIAVPAANQRARRPGTQRPQAAPRAPAAYREWPPSGRPRSPGGATARPAGRTSAATTPGQACRGHGWPGRREVSTRPRDRGRR